MNSLSRFREMLRRRWADRGHYRATCGWLLSLYNRALLRYPSVPLPGRGAVRPVKLATQREVFYVRLATSDWYVLEEIFVRREYAPVLGRLTTARTIIDLGANVGFSVRYWQEAFPDSRIIAVEPDEHNHQLCQRNIFVGPDWPPVTFVRACVAGRSRTVYLNRTASEWMYQMQDAVAGAPVETITMGELLKHVGPTEVVDLLKCDIEGAEEEVFADCRGWIGRVRNIIVEVHHPYDSTRFMSDIGPGFEVYKIVNGGDREVLFLGRPAT